jgi:flavin-dependent dehydrogenase
MSDTKRAIDVVGAGPAGLVAAINLVKAGNDVTLHEAAPGVGHRFHGDFQGIENWTTRDDPREFLKRIHVEVNFRFEPYRGGVFVSPDLRRRESERASRFFTLSKGEVKRAVWLMACCGKPNRRA